MEINRNNIIEICRINNIHPDKNYGQNFLIESKYSERIVSSLYLENEERVLEIGPGLGSLTHFLSEKNNVSDVVDVDLNMVGYLENCYKDNRNINVVFSDIRRHDVSIYQKIVGNLPYNLTTEIISYILLNATKCKRMVFMCQLEAFNHFFDTSGSEYGPISVLVHLMGKIKKEFVVGKNSFYPAPKVESVVFSINISCEDKKEAVSAYKLSKYLFLNRRKTILNNLSSYLGNKDKAKEMLEKTNIPLNYRPEEILPSKYLDLLKTIGIINIK